MIKLEFKTRGKIITRYEVFSSEPPFMINIPETTSDIYTLAVDNEPPVPSSSRLSNTPLQDQRQIGMSYGMLDEDGLPFEPVKLKTFSLCCN